MWQLESVTWVTVHWYKRTQSVLVPLWDKHFLIVLPRWHRRNRKHRLRPEAYSKGADQFFYYLPLWHA